MKLDGEEEECGQVWYCGSGRVEWLQGCSFKRSLMALTLTQ